MYTVRSVDVLSCAKVMGALYGALGLILLPFFALASFASFFGNGQAISSFTMFVIAVLCPVIYGIFGFLMGALTAWIYNLSARWVGGMRLELKIELDRPTSIGETLGQ